MTEQRNPKGPKSFGEVARGMMAGAPRLTPQEEAEVDAMPADTLAPEPVAERPGEEEENGPPDESALARAAEGAGEEGAHGARIVAQVPIPAGMPVPPYKQIGYYIFKPGLTERPDLGVRTCVTWGLSVADEGLARKAARGESTRMYEEMTKRTIRVMDGVRADWSGKGGKGNVNRYWEEIGPKARSFLINGYLKTHTPTVEETADFFLNCTTYRTSVVG